MKLKERLLSSKLFKDSFWAVFGNGMGNALILLAGILIARFLGKDLYGEYGMVKTTMLYIASFATFGLGFTSTKYIANAIQENPGHLRSIVRSSLTITLSFSGMIAVLLLLLAPMIADYLEEKDLVIALRALAVVIIFKAITTTQIGILSGFKDFKHVAYNNLCSGLFMLVICIPLTYFFSLEGSLTTLLLYQIFNAVINYYSVRRHTKELKDQEHVLYYKEMLGFSFPVALQESSYTVCNWAAIMLLTKYASLGDVGLYTVGAQWNSIVLMIPLLLNNVVLSYLSSNVSDIKQHSNTVNRMLVINFCTTLIPFVVVYVLADFIASFYGSTFSDLPTLMRIMVFTTILESTTFVFKSELMAQGRTWLLFTLRFLRDACFVGLVFYVLAALPSNNGAMSYAWCSVAISIGFFVAMWCTYLLTRK